MTDPDRNVSNVNHFLANMFFDEVQVTAHLLIFPFTFPILFILWTHLLPGVLLEKTLKNCFNIKQALT